jgi:hypothetical protein
VYRIDSPAGEKLSFSPAGKKIVILTNKDCLNHAVYPLSYFPNNVQAASEKCGYNTGSYLELTHLPNVVNLSYAILAYRIGKNSQLGGKLNDRFRR